MWLALVLAVQAAAPGFRNADPPSPCTFDPLKPCQVSCGTAGTVDLSTFTTHMTASYFHAVDSPDPSQSHDYYFLACGAINTQVTCTGGSVPMPVAVQTWGDPKPQPPNFPADTCAGLGSLNSSSCTMATAPPVGGNGTSSTLSCAYSNGYQGRSVTFNYGCTPTFTAPTAQQNPDGNSYTITFAGPSACAAPGGKKNKMGWGSIFLIVFPVTLAVYLGAGYYYNYRVNELRGVEAVPQLAYWKEVPGLVKDGAVFSYQKTSAGIQYLTSKGQPADPALKEALAADEDGAGSSTAYEESKA